MLFFKHFSDARLSTSLQNIGAEIGYHRAYACYFILVELCTAKWDLHEEGWDKCIFRFNSVYLGKELRLHQRQQANILARYAQQNCFSAAVSDRTTTIHFPNLLKFLDKHKKHNAMMRPRQSLAATLEKEKEKEKEKDYNGQMAILADDQSSSPIDFLEAYRRYPRKEKKQRGIQIVKRDVKTPQDFRDLLQAIDRYIAHINKNKIEPKFIKHFSTFMGEWREWLEGETGTVTGIRDKQKEFDDYISKCFAQGEENNAK